MTDLQKETKKDLKKESKKDITKGTWKGILTVLKKVKIVVSARELSNGYKIPYYYGLAYRDWLSGYAYFYIIPLNLFIRFGRWFYYTTMRPLKVPRWLEFEEKIYRKGYDQAWEDSRDMEWKNIKGMIITRMKELSEGDNDDRIASNEGDQKKKTTGKGGTIGGIDWKRILTERDQEPQGEPTEEKDD